MSIKQLVCEIWLGVLILAMERFGDCVCQCEEFGNHERCLGFGTRRMLMISALPVSRLESFWLQAESNSCV